MNVPEKEVSLEVHQDGLTVGTRLVINQNSPENPPPRPKAFLNYSVSEFGLCPQQCRPRKSSQLWNYKRTWGILKQETEPVRKLLFHSLCAYWAPTMCQAFSYMIATNVYHVGTKTPIRPELTLYDQFHRTDRRNSSYTPTKLEELVSSDHSLIRTNTQSFADCQAKILCM